MRKVLIVIDMQNDFIDAALGTKEAAAIVDAVKDKIRSYPSENIIATMDTHYDNHMETKTIKCELREGLKFTGRKISSRTALHQGNRRLEDSPGDCGALEGRKNL